MPGRLLLFLFVNLVFCLNILGQSDPAQLDASVCVIDFNSEAPLEGALVEGRIEGGEPTTGVTANDGCVSLLIATPVGIEDLSTPLEAFVAGEPYPNPVSGKAIIPLQANRPSTLQLELFSVQGRRMLPVHTIPVLPGHNAINIDLSSLPAGLYLYRLSDGNTLYTGTLVNTRLASGPLHHNLSGSRVSGHQQSAHKKAAASLQAVQIKAEKQGYETATITLDIEDGEEVEISLEPSIADTSAMIPINDLATASYMGYQGGLYPAGQNTAPASHHVAGLSFANTVEPLNTNGAPDPNGNYILLSIGMSNTTQEFCSQNSHLPCDDWTFMGQAAADLDVNTSSLVIVNGARGGRPADDWVSPQDENYDRVKNEHIETLGLSEAQVQIVWVKVANPKPTVALPDPQADAFLLKQQLGSITRTLKIRYPNVKQIFVSSRIYAGYAEGVSKLNPEPYAYESGFATKWVIEAQINQMQGEGVDERAGDLDYSGPAAWLAWGPYLWANGATPRSDGLTWLPEDFDDDFTHPGMDAEQKVGAALLDFFKTSSYTKCWFVNGGVCE